MPPESVQIEPHELNGRAATGATIAPRRPVEVAVTSHVPASTATVRVVVVTWNRKSFAENILRSLAGQKYPIGLMDVTVIDNASTDGTTEHLAGLFGPEAIIANRTELAHEPNFQREPLPGGRGPKNALGFRSLTIVRNQANVGGCGGFNTGFGLTEWLSDQDPASAPDYIWLVDDDADVPPDALAQLVRAMESATDVGLVGSRTVNIADRLTTIETTIYYNFNTGAMQDDCPVENPKFRDWRRWTKQTGGTRGRLDFHGLMDVDVVSACSMLARWSAVVGSPREGRPGVGFWDWRYFIYCDDADWCLRFAAAGWRVVLNLDAVVFHTPWNLKLTPARIYYANRNKVWMGQKVLRGAQLRLVTRRAMKSMLKDSLKAALHRRLFHADIILDTARDVAVGRSGKTGSDGPPGEPVFEAMRRLGLLRTDARVAIVANQTDSPMWIADLKRHIDEQIAERHGAGLAAPRFLPVLRNDVPNPPADAMLYGGRWPSRLKKQLHLFARRPDAVVVFEQTNDLPVLFRGGWNLHIDQKKPTITQVERDGWLARLRFIGRWVPTAARCTLYACTIKPYQRTGRYG